MAQKTDLNVSPYYDDFNVDDDFHRVLFRPGFAIQARELTQLQSILQNQVEKHGRHMFKEGTLVIPGQTGFTNEFYAVKLQSTFNSGAISGYLSSYVGSTITGATSGVTARVVAVDAATTTDPETLYVKYLSSATNTSGTSVANVTTEFIDGESIQSDIVINSLNAGSNSATLLSSAATAQGSSASIQEGVYFIRGNFVRVTEQRIVLDKYTNTPSYRVGLTVTESLITPEADTSLLDNATGSSNVNAKGAHRLKYTLTLAKLDLGSAADDNFVELFRVQRGIISQKARNTEYSVLGETFARRTFDESGDYAVRPFDIDIRETLNDGLNNGLYSANANTDSGNTASEQLMTVQVSPGKAYVKGYEIETVSPSFIDINKPRTTAEFDSAVTPMEVGNFARVQKVFGSPDLHSDEEGTSAITPYKTVSLVDKVTSTRGAIASGGTVLGFARVKGFEHESNNLGSSTHYLTKASVDNAEFKLYLFDIRMITKLTVSAAPSPSNNVPIGAKITGVNSGATGFVTTGTTSTTINLITTVGTFQTGEKILSTSSAETDQIVENSSNADITISAVTGRDFSEVKQVFMDDPQSGQDFTANLKLSNQLKLSGVVTTTSGDPTVTGFGTSFTTELKAGDHINIDGVGEKIVASVTNATELELTTNGGTAQTTVGLTRLRAQLQDQEKNLSLRKVRKTNTKTLKTDGNGNVSQTFITVRKQFIKTSNGSGIITFGAATGETFSAKSNVDYIAQVLTAGSAIGGSGTTAAAGDILNLNSTLVTAFTISGNSLSVTAPALLGSGAVVKLVATVTRSVSVEKSKTKNASHLVLVDNDVAEYGTSARHKDISLGRGDVYKLLAVYDSESGSNPVIPQWTLTGVSGTFVKGEIITGATSGVTATVVNPTTPLTFVPTISTANFTSSEKITGGTSAATATLDTFTAGSRDITSRFELDNGQRDNYYDVSRIRRKAGQSEPAGKLLIVCHYFDHGTGDFFSVDSYSSVDYKEIPVYSATRVDPEVREPTGEYDLRDAFDFRPKVANSTQTTSTIQNQTCYKVTDFSFDFTKRTFSGAGASEIRVPKDNSNMLYDFEHYLGRIDLLALTENGQFKIVSGTAAEDPVAPKPLENAMLIAKLNFNPYILDEFDASFTKSDNKRYTMRDIGKLEARINNIEYYTALNLLEKDAQSLEVTDSDGLNRFKSGFVVDNFAGHATGDVKHPDYRCAIDMSAGELRPKYFMKGVKLLEENSNDTSRTLNNYAKTGDLITLPYTHQIVAQQVYASRVENLNPVLNFSWAGICTLSPSGDEWFETERAPDLVVNREGNFDTILAQNRNALGTIWNAWQTQWTGETVIGTNQFRDTSWQRARRQVPFRPVIQRTTTQQTGVATRQGVQTNVIAQIDRESQGDRIISRAVIPFMRSVNISFSAVGLKPLTRVYPFFDKNNVTSHTTPNGGSAGAALISTANGDLSGTFLVPDPTVSGNPRFRTGERVFRLTSSTTNDSTTEPETFCQATFSATGILNTVQETIIATRNARVETRTVQQTQNVVGQTTTRDDVVGWWDPLAQSFMPQAEGGEYITKVDAYFSTKDANIPVTCQIREMQNGYPTTKVLPFASKTLNPSGVSLSSNASVATTFIFDSPVYVKNGTEYCIVLQTDSDQYKAWISRMGELDVGGTRMISEQPYLGVLFKSQNNTTWTAYDFEDLKFTLYRAKFSTGINGVMTLVNEPLPVKKLEPSSIETSNGSNVVKVYHRDHGMYSTSNNVIIAGVVANAGSAVNGIPITELNATHTAISNIQIDSYTITVSSNATSTGTAGGNNVTATENALIDQLQTLVPTVEHPDTSLIANIRSTSGTSPSGTQTSFNLQAASQSEVIPINDGYIFENSRLIASPINETNELSGSKSFRLSFTMGTTKDNLSPVIDLDRKSILTVANRLDNVDTSSDVYPTTSYVSPNEPDGDSGEAVYVTRKVALKTPATSIKVIFDAVRFNSSQIQVMYKILRSDDASDFDELGWRYFNTDGSPDTTVNDSTNQYDFLENTHSVEDLDEFIAFSIKIRMQGTNSSEVPRIKDLRAIALAT